MVRTENKDPDNQVYSFMNFVVIFRSFKFERVRKRTDTKTRWNRARDFSDPPITLIFLAFLS